MTPIVAMKRMRKRRGTAMTISPFPEMESALALFVFGDSEHEAAFD
jgi:hypothetical protein